MAKSYFDDLHFPEPEIPAEFIPKTKVERQLPPAKSFAEAVAYINQEIQKMQEGTSELVSYPLHIKNGICPAINVLNQFTAYPTEKNMLEFFKLTEQDFGGLAARAFKAKILEVVKRGV